MDNHHLPAVDEAGDDVVLDDVVELLARALVASVLAPDASTKQEAVRATNAGDLEPDRTRGRATCEPASYTESRLAS